jgi:hypothetical protein
MFSRQACPASNFPSDEIARRFTAMGKFVIEWAS